MLDDRTKLHFPISGSVALPLILRPCVLRCIAAGPGGHPLTVLLDTGTDPSAIDLGLARRLGLRLGEFALGSDAASDDIPFTETVLPWLRLGDLTLRDLYLLAVDLGNAPFKIDLVLGYNILSALTLIVDYHTGMVHLRHPDLEPMLPGLGGVSLPLQFFEHFPALAGARLEAGSPGRNLELPLLTIDTGSNSALTLSPDLAARAGQLLEAPWVTGSTGHGFAGGCDVLQSIAAGLRIGPFALADIELDAPEGRSGDLGRLGRANLGNGVLSRFARLTLDYRRALCILEPQPAVG